MVEHCGLSHGLTLDPVIVKQEQGLDLLYQLWDHLLHSATPGAHLCHLFPGVSLHCSEHHTKMGCVLDQHQYHSRHHRQTVHGFKGRVPAVKRLR